MAQRMPSPVDAQIAGKCVIFPDAAHLALFHAGADLLRGAELADTDRAALWAHFAGYVEHQHDRLPFAEPAHVADLAADFAEETLDLVRSSPRSRIDARAGLVIDPDLIGAYYRRGLQDSRPRRASPNQDTTPNLWSA